MEIEITPNNRDRIELPREIDDDWVVLKGLTDYTIRGRTFSNNRNETDMLKLEGCVNCKIINCTFKDKSTKGNFIHIIGLDERVDGVNERGGRNNRIEGCTFKDKRFDGENGGETIIVGCNQWSGCKFETTIRKCEFINCTGEAELVSIKSCNNIFELNEIRSNCNGNITLRHGGHNKILHNLFVGGAGGIRVLGDNNTIKGNYHKNNNNQATDESRRPLIIENVPSGDRGEEWDPHYNNNHEPRSNCRERENHAKYARARDNIIEDNTYVNCRGVCVLWGYKDQGRKPRGNKFRKNTLIANDDRDSRFLVFFNDAETDRDRNEFRNNRMWGNNAEDAELPGRIERLGSRPNIPEPDAGPD
jgi:Chondroitinase B